MKKSDKRDEKRERDTTKQKMKNNSSEMWIQIRKQENLIYEMLIR
jgi:hypothetical protein